MRNIALLLALFFCFACSSDKQNFKLEKGTPAYELAEKLAEKMPVFNPETNQVLATTDKFNVTIGDVVDRFRSRFGKQSEQLASLPENQLQKLLGEYAEMIAVNRMIVNEADKKGITVTEQQVDSIYNKQVESAGSAEVFEKFLYDNGVTVEIAKNDFKEQEMMKQYMAGVQKESSVVTDQEIEEAKTSDRLATVRHILLNTQNKTEDQKKEIYERMQQILQEAKSGKDFAELAKQYSEDGGSKDKGGLYEDFPKGMMVKEFEEAAFNTPVGELSDIIETPYGYHILLVIDRKKENRQDSVIAEELKKLKSRNSITNELDRLKEMYNFELVDLG